MHLSGYVANPDFHRSQNDKQWMFLNRRIVKDKLLNHAIKQSYIDRLPEGRFPGCMLYLEVPSSEVDVNVHPTKHEVRFQQPRLVHDFITSELVKVLNEIEKKPLAITKDRYDTAPKHQIEIKEAAQTYDLMDSHDERSTDIELQAISNHHAIAKMMDAFFLVNTHKLYQKGLKKRLKNQDGPLESRPLLVPVRYKISKFSPDVFLKSHQEQLNQCGFDVNRFSDDCLVIRTIPKMLPGLNIQSFVDDMAHKVSTISLDEIKNIMVKNISHPTWPYDEDFIHECRMFLLNIEQTEPNEVGIYKKLNDKICSEMLSE